MINLMKGRRYSGPSEVAKRPIRRPFGAIPGRSLVEPFLKPLRNPYKSSRQSVECSR